MSAFIVETETPGFAVARVEHKMGIRGSPTAELTFDDVRVPVENRLGAEGDGFRIAMNTLDRSRLSIAAQAVGISQGAIDEATRYLICTDGLSDVIDDAKIAAVLERDRGVAAVFELWRAAITGGGPDNITVVLAEIASVEVPPEAEDPGAG